MPRGVGLPPMVGLTGQDGLTWLLLFATRCPLAAAACQGRVEHARRTPSSLLVGTRLREAQYAPNALGGPEAVLGDDDKATVLGSPWYPTRPTELGQARKAYAAVV